MLSASRSVIPTSLGTVTGVSTRPRLTWSVTVSPLWIFAFAAGLVERMVYWGFLDETSVVLPITKSSACSVAVAVATDSPTTLGIVGAGLGAAIKK